MIEQRKPSPELLELMGTYKVNSALAETDCGSVLSRMMQLGYEKDDSLNEPWMFTDGKGGAFQYIPEGQGSFSERTFITNPAATQQLMKVSPDGFVDWTNKFAVIGMR